MARAVKNPRFKGARFGRLTLLDLAPKRFADEPKTWVVRCDCGIEKCVLDGNLGRNSNNTCGSGACRIKVRETTSHQKAFYACGQRLVWLWEQLNAELVAPDVRLSDQRHGSGRLARALEDAISPKSP